MARKKQAEWGDIIGGVGFIVIFLFPLYLIGFLHSLGVGIVVFVFGVMGTFYFVVRTVRDKEPQKTVNVSTEPRPEMPRLNTSRRQPKSAPTPSDGRYKVIDVVDGDTIRTRLWSIRLIGIDAPETVHPSRSVERFGKVASAMARELLLGHYVRLEKDISQGDSDSTAGCSHMYGLKMVR